MGGVLQLGGAYILINTLEEAACQLAADLCGKRAGSRLRSIVAISF